ncbi:MAG: Ig-like domain-containing protein [Kofleriaceae bacterium]|nr:Ig-like domain-containing protein [Kofleriaceae bacterium]
MWLAVALAGCGSDSADDTAPPPEVVFTYPLDQQLDVPLGARLLISFSQPIESESGAVSVTGPNGNVDVAVHVVGRGRTLSITSDAFEPATTYAVSVAGGPLFQFTTRSDRPRVGAPTLIALDGSNPASPGTFRPIFETSTLQLVFSEPLDPRSVTLEPGAIELVDPSGVAVPITYVANGIHVSLDPVGPLTAGATYELRLGDKLADVGGERMAPAAISFTPIDSIGRGAIRQTFRTRQDGDPAAAIERTDAANVMEVSHPLIGEARAFVEPNALATELGDPLALGGPIAFSIPKGQRFATSALDILLAGTIPSGLSTGDISIELLTDGGGRIYRNPFRPDETPDNTRAPLNVDLSFDLAVYATDPTGNAVLAQTIPGVQLTGLAFADEGVLAIETLGALEINLLGISAAPTNIVLDLLSAPGASLTADVQAPTLLTSLPAADSHAWVADEGIELVFDEPIDIDRARAGGIVLHDAGSVVESTLEPHGSVVVVRPRSVLNNHSYRVELIDVADRAGNLMPPASLAIATQNVATDMPASVLAVSPGAPCSLVDADDTTAGRCAGGNAADDRYKRFALAANEQIAVVFDHPVRGSSLTLGKTCNTGSVRVEHVGADGACIEAVSGTLLVRERDLAFVPEKPWVVDEQYRLRLRSGPNGTCDPGEVCGVNGRPASFDPLAGTTNAASGGPDLVIDFVGTVATTATTLLANAAQGDDNRVALRIAGTEGLITSATFEGPDCIPSTPVVESCMYVLGAIPAQLGERRDNCTLPDGTTVASCIPVAMSAQAMYSTSVTMTAGAAGIPLTTATGTSVMRVRERPDGPLEGYIVDRDGVPTMVVALDLYMDAPDMSLPLAQHDMHSKPLAVSLEGPLTFRPDGRIAITLHNLADVPIAIGINAPLGITGTVKVVVPAGEMRLQLMSKPARGRLP